MPGVTHIVGQTRSCSGVGRSVGERRANDRHGSGLRRSTGVYRPTANAARYAGFTAASSFGVTGSVTSYMPSAYGPATY